MSIESFKDLYFYPLKVVPHDIYRPRRWDNDKYRVPEVYNACTAFIDGTLNFCAKFFLAVAIFN